MGSVTVDDIDKLRLVNRLKSVYRSSSVGDRKESSAEHSWACLVLADFLISKLYPDGGIDRLKVYELLLYHDLVEIEVGDTPLSPFKDYDRSEKRRKELAAAESLSKKLPSPLSSKFLSLFTEFEEQRTLESRFARAVDQLEGEIHEIDYKDDWKGWTEEFLVSKKGAFFDDFPELKELFFDLVRFFRENGYFSE